MKIRYFFALSGVFFAAPAVADDMVTYTWDPGCNHTMTTNHFMLAPGQEVEIYVDLSQCTDEQIGSLLLFGLHTTRNRSRQLTSKSKIRLMMSAVYASGNLGPQEHSDTGSLLVDVASVQAQGCNLRAKNMGRKEMKLRIRSQLIPQ